MIEVNNLSISYHGRALFTHACFTLQPGERCGLIGRNGSGKTTLFRLLTGEETPDTGIVTRGKHYRIGVMRQHIHFTEPTILAQCALGLPENEKTSLYKVEKILFGLGFQESDMHRPPSDFSGGYQLRLHLAELLIQEPNCLLLDEPTNYLDIVSIRWLTRFLSQWRGELILISHDRSFMDHVCTHTMGIHREQIFKLPCKTQDFLTQLSQREEIHERTRLNQEKKRAHDQEFIDRFGAKATKAAQAQSRVKKLEKMVVLEKLKDIQDLEFAFQYAEFPGRNLLSCQDMTFSYSPNSEQPLIQPLTLAIERGERIAIIGKNGRGKSTLLRLFAQDLEPVSGKLNFSERTRIGYFGQTHISRLHPHHTIEEEISSANPTLSRTTVKGICGLMMFSGAQSDKQTSVLSGGEKSRVLLGKIVATPCNLLLLDEPTHHLDMESVEALIHAINAFQGTVILVTHNEWVLEQIPLNKLLVCREKTQELFLGNYQDFLDKNGWEEEASTSGPKRKVNIEDRKQERAKLITERARVLKPFDQLITRYEEDITRLETKLSLSQVKCAEYSESGKSQELQESCKEIKTIEKQLTALYTKLENAMTERDTLHTEWTSRIEAL